MADLYIVNRLVKSVWASLEVVELIGSGPSGDVYKTVSGNTVSALKIIRVPKNPDEIAAIGQNEILRDRAKAEYTASLEALCNTVRAQQLLRSEPNILTVHEYVAVPCENGIGSYVLIHMECLNSVDRLGEFSPIQTVQLGIDICAALEVCERNYIRHGNIKPSNIFVNEMGVYKLGDIGISQVLGTGGADQVYQNCFTAPEVAGGIACDIRSDIYSIGALMYFLLGDRTLPFYVSHGQPLAPLRAMTPELNMLLATACADNPNDRYQDASSLKHELVNLYTSMVFGEENSSAETAANASAAVETEAVNTADPEAAVAVASAAASAAGAVLESVFGGEESTPSAAPVDPEATVSLEGGSGTAEFSPISNPEKPQFFSASVQISGDVQAVDATQVFEIPTKPAQTSPQSASKRGNSVPDAQSFKADKKLENKRHTEPKIKNGRDKEKKRGSTAIIVISIIAAIAVLAALGFAIYCGVEIYRGLSFEGYSPDDENAPDPTKIEIKNLPTKLTYYPGETLDTEGLEIEAHYGMFRSSTLTEGFTVEQVVFTEEGTHEIEVTFGGKTASFEVNVAAASLTKLKLQSKPEKLDYVYNQVIDFTGLELAAYYSDGAVLVIDDGYEVSSNVANGVGAQVITVTYGMKTVSFSINVSENSVESISVQNLPTKLEYAVGEAVNTEGLLLNVVYSNGISAAVSSDITVEPEVLNEVGTQTVFINYRGVETAFEVTVTEAKATGIIVTSMPLKLNYTKGESLSLEGIEISEQYSNGTSVRITDGYIYLPTTANTVGAQVVTVYYGEFSTTFNVVVKSSSASTTPNDAATVSSVSIKSKPAKLIYNVGETVYSSGLRLTVKYLDGSTKEITGGFTYSPTVVNTAGQQYITVNYGGKSTGFYVTVNNSGHATPKSLSIKTQPSKVYYYVGDSIDTSGLTLTLKYSDGTSETITSGFTLSKTKLDSAGTHVITVTYSGLSTTFNAAATEKPVSASGTCGASMTWKLENNTLTIRGSGHMNEFLYRGAPWQSYASKIKYIVVENGVISISANAFIELSVETISIPESVTLIEPNAIFLCSKLTSISVSTNNMAYASSGGYLYSKDLTKLIVYPTGRSDTTLTLPSNVTSIGGYRIFAGSALKEIIITENVYLIDGTAFYGAEDLEKITVRSRNMALTSVNGVLFNKGMTELICYPAAKTSDSFIIPDTVKYVREYAFAGNTSLKGITVPVSIAEINGFAFSGVSSLSHVTYIGTAAQWDNILRGIGNDYLNDANISCSG